MCTMGRFDVNRSTFDEGMREKRFSQKNDFLFFRFLHFVSSDLDL